MCENMHILLYSDMCLQCSVIGSNLIPLMVIGHQPISIFYAIGNSQQPITYI